MFGTMSSKFGETGCLIVDRAAANRRLGFHNSALQILHLFNRSSFSQLHYDYCVIVAMVALTGNFGETSDSVSAGLK